MKSILTTLVVVAAATITSYTADAAAPTITGVTAQQRYPWNGKVDISYMVTGDIAAEANQSAVFTSLKVTAIDKVATRLLTRQTLRRNFPATRRSPQVRTSSCGT